MAVNVIDEQHPAKVAAIFKTESDASSARQALIDQGDFASKLINIIKPEDPNLSKKIEPESHGIAKTILKSHGILGIVGFILASILVAAGPTFTQNSPLPTYLALSFFGLLIGLMVAGAITLRPDHDPLINEIIEASHHQQWTVIVQTDNRGAVNKAKEILETDAVTVKETI